MDKSILAPIPNRTKVIEGRNLPAGTMLVSSDIFRLIQGLPEAVKGGSDA